jgi:mRNA interferase MazF
MVIRQGDLFWVDLGFPHGSEPGFRHPYVVIQNDVFNSSKVNTVIAAALTSNMSRAAVPGNVALKKGEANLPKASVVNVTQVMTLDKSDLKEKIGSLSPDRVKEIVNGLRLVTEVRGV